MSTENPVEWAEVLRQNQLPGTSAPEQLGRGEHLALQRLQKQIELGQAAAAALGVLSEILTQVYGLKPGDRIDTETGVILRGPAK
jgi:hypothetical protein